MECLRGSHRGLLFYPPLDLVHSPPRSSRTHRTRSIPHRAHSAASHLCRRFSSLRQSPATNWPSGRLKAAKQTQTTPLFVLFSHFSQKDVQNGTDFPHFLEYTYMHASKKLDSQASLLHS